MGSQVQLDEDKFKPKRFGFRHVQMLMLSLCIMFNFGILVFMSLAIVAMTDATQNGIFDWSHQIQSVILSSFRWGYLLSKVPGGELVARYGGKVVLATVMAITAVALVLLPLAARYGDWKAVCALRILQGLALGVVYPAVHNLIGKWVPLQEKNRIGAMVYASGQLGTAIQLLMAGFIAEVWGWEAIFYVNGIIGTVWVILYSFLGSSTPQQSKLISAEERLYIQRSLGHIGGHKKMKTPWKALFTSLAFIAVIVAHAGNSYSNGVVLSEMPTYLKKIQGINLKANGMMSALPYFGSYLMSFPFGFLADYILQKKFLSVTAVRKISNSIGFLGPAVFLILLSYFSPDVTTAVILLTTAVSLNSGYYTGYNLSHLDMAPNHAGTMMGISGSIANCAALTAPLTAGFMIRDELNPAEWRKLFFLTAGVYSVSNIFFLIFATSKKQKWNEPIEENLHDHLKEKI